MLYTIVDASSAGKRKKGGAMQTISSTHRVYGWVYYVPVVLELIVDIYFLVLSRFSSRS